MFWKPQRANWAIIGLLACLFLIALINAAPLKNAVERNRARLLWTHICRNRSLSAQARSDYLATLIALKVPTPFMFFRPEARVRPDRNFALEDVAKVNHSTDPHRFEAEDPRLGLDTGQNAFTDSYVAIYGGGGPHLPLLLLDESDITVNIRALHSTPPPILFAVIVYGTDRVIAGNLAFERGDRTWGTESMQIALPGGCYWLEMPFINDFFDSERQLDRNAYIDWVEIYAARHR